MSRPVLPHADHVTTSLLTQAMDAPPSSCLPQALRAARDGLDEIVFLAAGEDEARPGHVVLRDIRTAVVREPGSPDAGTSESGSSETGAAPSAEAYAEQHRQRILCAVPVGVVRRFLALPIPERGAALPGLGAPLSAIAHLPFGVVGAVGGKSPPEMPKGAGDTEKWLAALDDAVSDIDKEKLAQPMKDAALVKGHIEKYKRGDDKMNSEMPDDVKQAMGRLTSNEATGKLVTKDGAVTRDALGDFMKKMEKSAQHAAEKFDEFQRNNQDADAIAVRQAVNASILHANLPIVDAATKDGKVDGLHNIDDLKAVAEGKDNAGLADPLRNAAAFYANKGQFASVDNAGGGVNGKDDGVITSMELEAMVALGTGKGEDDSISKLQSSAITQAIADEGGDASKVGPEYFEGGGTTASAADKAAAMMQIGEALGKYEAGLEKWKSPEDRLVGTSNNVDPHDPALSPERAEFRKSMTDRMDKLSQDPDVQKFVSEKVPVAMKTMVESDPALTEAMQKRYDELIGGKGLEEAFSQKGDDGEPLSTTEALGAYAQKASFYQGALGAPADLAKGLEGAPQEIKDKVEAGYEDIVSGKATEKLRNEGKSPEEAQTATAMQKVLYDAVLDEDTVAKGTDRYNDGIAKAGRDDLMKDKSPQEAADAMLAGLGVSGIDDPALEKLVTENMDTLVPSNDPANPVRPPDVVTITRGVHDLMRGGLKYDDAMEKVRTDPKYERIFGAGSSDAYRAGVLHGASGLLLGGMALSNIGKSPVNDVMLASQAIQAGSLLADGGIKAYTLKFDGLKNEINDLEKIASFPDSDAARAAQNALPAKQANYDALMLVPKHLSNISTAVGGVAGGALGVAASAISLQDALKKGDTLGAGMSGTLVGLTGAGTLSAAAEVGAFLAPRVMAGVGAAGAAAAGGVAAAVGGVVGGAAAVVGVVFSVIQMSKDQEREWKQQDDWNKDLKTNLEPLGIEVPRNGNLFSADGPSRISGS